ncbi:MAG: HlyD family secretion protein, partial [Muribaculaceae bacterium]|nr:HlyD family secretion protein [Muribaculaceae bacterium]
MAQEDNLNSPAAVRRENRVLMIAMLMVIVVVIGLAIIGFFFLEHPDNLLQGQADATSVRISGKLPGRVVELYVKEGDMVHAGDTLVHIHSSLAEAKLAQAESMKDVAVAGEQKVDAGTRVQIIQAAEALVSQAESARQITQKTYERMENLFKEGVVSAQKRDEAKAAYDAAVGAEAAARSQLSLARAGAQREDRAAAASMVGVAQGGIAEVQSLLEDQYLTAPCDSQIDQVYPQVGELVSLGAPIMSLLKIDDKWVTFNVREDYLSDLKLGHKMHVMIPALDKKETDLEIYYIRDMGSYATWRATKSTGEWD